MRKRVISAESVLTDNNVPARAHLAPIDYPRSAPFDSVDARRLRMSANRDNYSNFMTKSPVAIRPSRRKSLAARKDYVRGVARSFSDVGLVIFIPACWISKE